MSNFDFFIRYESQTSKKRVGSKNDGGYVIADGLEYDCLLSCGVSNDITFEEEFLKLYPQVPCFAFDGTVEGLPNLADNITFIKKNIGVLNSETTTNLMDFLASYKSIFLKMDIETFEFRWFQSIPDELLKNINQIVVEFHFPFSEPGFTHLDAPLPVEQKVDVLKNIIKTHTLIHIHPNNCCKTTMYHGVLVPNVFECTYVRSDIQPKHNQCLDPIPSPFDSPNVNGSDIFLSGYPYTL